MSETRDADVLVETIDDLAERYAGQRPKTTFTRIRGRLQTKPAADASTHADALRALAGEPWPLGDLGPDDLAASLRRTYARGRKAFATADHAPTTANLHEWRKRVKDLWYQQRLLEQTWPGVMKAQAKEAKRLSKLLGADHDLAVLAEHVDDPDLTELIDTRRAELLAEARELGRRVYAERPQAFARRARRYVTLTAA